MMHMTFYWGKKVTVLFDSWSTDSWTSYSLSLLVCFLFSVFYQYMEDRRLRLKLLSSTTTSQPPPPSTIDAPLLYRSDKIVSLGTGRRIAEALTFGINSAIGYLLMLAIMSFNGGVFLAVVFGLAVGYLLFRTGDERDVLVVDNPCACA